MLVPARKPSEQIVIDGEHIVSVRIVESRSESVCIGVIDPADNPIDLQQPHQTDSRNPTDVSSVDVEFKAS